MSSVLRSDPPPGRAVRSVLRGRRVLLALAIVGFVGHQIAETLVPVAIGLVIDRAIGPGDGTALLWSLAALGGLFLVLLTAWRLGELTSVRLGESGARDLRRLVAGRALGRSGFARPRTPGEVLSIAGTDAERTAEVVWIIGAAAAQAAAVLTAAVSLLLISLPLGVGVLIATPVIVLVLHFATGPLERRRDAEQAAAAAASATAADLLTGFRAIVGLRAEAAATARFAAVSRESLSAARRAISSAAAYTVASMIASTALLAGIVAAASASAIAGRITVGELVAVLGLAQFLHWPVRGLAFVGAELAGARASARRVDRLLGEPPAHGRPHAAAAPRIAPPAPDSGPGEPVDVVLDALRTPHSGPYSVRIPEGAYAAIAVADPRGARELQELFAGLRRPESGRLSIAGRDPDDPAARALVVAPPHHAAVFAGTLRENLAFHGDDSAHTLEAAAEAAALADVRSLGDQGWDLAIGERGLTLSGGQRQRVALARGIARGSAVLVLHDPASAVDSVTEAAVAARIPAERTGLTTILIDAGPTLTAHCDLTVEEHPV